LMYVKLCPRVAAQVQLEVSLRLKWQPIGKLSSESRRDLDQTETLRVQLEVARFPESRKISRSARNDK
jgi:hypothetical protein